MWDRQIPYIAYESEMARHERTIKRLAEKMEQM